MSIFLSGQMQKDFGYDFCRTVSDKNPLVVGGMRRTDCSMVSDGAAALVLTDVQTALGMKKAIAFRAAKHVQDYLPMAKRDVIAFEGPAKARSEEHTSELQSLMRISYAVFCLKKKQNYHTQPITYINPTLTTQ